MGRAAEATKGVPVIGEQMCRLRNFCLLASCERCWLNLGRLRIILRTKVLELVVALLIGSSRTPRWFVWSGTNTNALMLFDDREPRGESDEPLVLYSFISTRVTY